MHVLLAVIIFLLVLPFEPEGHAVAVEPPPEEEAVPLEYSERTQRKENSGTYYRQQSNVREQRPPNIVLFLLDDLDAEFGSINFMPETLRLLGEAGVTFDNAYTTAPLCCPSRSSLLTGMYPHNTHIRSNSNNCAKEEWQKEGETRTFGVYLQRRGYRTAYIGKYLNQYKSDRVPPGWTHWVANTRNTVYYNYTLVVNGRKKRHGDNYNQDYFTDIITNYTVNFLTDSLTGYPDKPVALMLSFPAPHGRQVAAPQFQNLFQNVTSHRIPNWNYSPNPDKQPMLRNVPAMDVNQQAFTDWLHMKRLQTLPSVDNAVKKVVETLEQYGQLDNTYLALTSDHGYHLGQFGMVEGKSNPYEFDIKIPFLMRGPGIPAGVRKSDIVLNIDVAPTFLDIAGMPIPASMDGLSINQLFEQSNSNADEWRQSFVVEQGKQKKKKRQFPLRQQLKDLANNQEHATPELQIKGEHDRSIDGEVCNATGTECKVVTADHWVIPPLWTGRPVCICTETGGISFLCLRTINTTHNTVYCEFMDGFSSYYNLHTDPYQLDNTIDSLDNSTLSSLHSDLLHFTTCVGSQDCRTAREGESNDIHDRR